MLKAASSQTIPSCSNFLSYLLDFRTHCHYCKQVRAKLEHNLSLEVKTRLLEEATQAHIEAVKAHTKAVKAYQELRQKYLQNIKKSINYSNYVANANSKALNN